MNLEKLGENIKKYRLKANLSQKQLASLLHVSDKAISKWENNRCYPDISLIDELARALKVTTAELIDDKSTKEKDEQIKALKYTLLEIVMAVIVLIVFVIMYSLEINYAITLIVCLFLFVLLRQFCSKIIYKTKMFDITWRNL